MNASQRAFEIFQELDNGTKLISLNGFDSELMAVVSNGGVTLVQSWGAEPYEIFLPEECYKQLIKILQEKLGDN